MVSANTSNGDDLPIPGSASASSRTSTRPPTFFQLLWQWISACVAFVTAVDASPDPHVRDSRNANPLVDASPPKTFRELCRAIARNDPSVTSVSTHRDAVIAFPHAGIEALGIALLKSRNSTIASLELHVYHLLLLDELIGKKLNGCANHLLQWLEQAPPSLQTVHITASQYSVEGLLLVKILQAMVSVPNLHTLHVDVDPEQLRALADYLTDSPTVCHTLQTLHLAVSYGILARELDVRTAAQAIGALHGLRRLVLCIDQYGVERFLRALLQSSPLMIQQVRLVFSEGTDLYPGTAEALASFLTYSTQLQSVEIFHFSCSYNRVLTMIATALWTNPTIHSFGLHNATLSNATTTAFLNGMQSHQHAILKLQLTDCQFRMHPQTTGVDFANMLCGSKLEHIVLDHGVVSPRQIASFFATLSVNASTVRLRSMELELLFDSTMMHPVEYVAPFVASTIRLESLTICICSNQSRDDDLLLSAPVPAFLASMKSNASLREVKVVRKRDQQPAIRADAWRRMEAFTMRNGMLQPGLANVPRDLLYNARRRVRPALCRVALQASSRPDHEKVAMVMSLLATI